MAVVAMLAAAASSRAAEAEPTADASRASGCPGLAFGARTLKKGHCGPDVRTLTWMLKSTKVGRRTPPSQYFGPITNRTVKRFQKNRGIGVDGVVGAGTRETLVGTMKKSIATWYGPGLYGNTTACGQILRPRTVGVAHKRLPCGTRVVIRYKGRYVRTRVIDRGPYANGATWDLTNGARKKVGLSSTEHVRAAVVR